MASGPGFMSLCWGWGCVQTHLLPLERHAETADALRALASSPLAMIARRASLLGLGFVLD